MTNNNRLNLFRLHLAETFEFASNWKSTRNQINEKHRYMMKVLTQSIQTAQNSCQRLLREGFKKKISGIFH